MRGDSASFTECYTGLKAPVQKTDDFARFQRQYRNAARAGDATFVEFEGRFVWSGDASLRAVSIVSFKTIKDERTC